MGDELSREVPLNVTVTEGLRRRVKSRAARQGISMREYVRRALLARVEADEYVEDQGGR